MNQPEPRNQGTNSYLPAQVEGAQLYAEQPYYGAEVWTVADVLSVLRRYALLIGVVFAACVGAAYIYNARQTPIYSASADILVDVGGTTQGSSGSDVDPVAEMLNAGRARSIQTQVEVLKRRPIVEAALKSMKPPLSRKRKPDLKVEGIKDTDIIRVTVEDPSPKVAAGFANAVANAYIAKSQASNRRSATVTRVFLEQQLADKKRELDEATNRLKSYKETSGIASLDAETTGRMQRLAATEDQLASAQTQVRSIEAQLRAVRAQLSTAEQTYLASTSSSVDPVVTSMEGTIATLEVQRAGLLREFQPTAPEVQALDDQIAEARKTLQARVRQRMTTSGQTVAANPMRMALMQQVADLEAQADAQQARIRALEPMVRAERRAVSELPERERRLAALTRDVANLEQAYTTLQAKHQEVSVMEQAKLASASLLEPAEVPGAPIKPRKGLNLAVGALMGLMLGTMLAFFLDMLEKADDSVKSPDEAERALGLPVLGVIPGLPRSPQRLLIGSNDNSIIAESFRLLRSNVRFSNPDQPLRSIMVTSPASGEGKTTVAANLAIALAANGLRVILVDCDLRRASLAKLFGVENSRGLTSVVVGEMPIEEALQQVQRENLRLLATGPTPPNPVEFLDSQRCHEVLKELSGMADFVILDTPPASFLTDATVLCPQVDGVLIVARTRQTKQAAIRRVMNQLLMTKGNLVGMCLNRMPMSGHGYYYNYYMYGDYRAYCDQPRSRKGRRREALRATRAPELGPEGQDSKDGRGHAGL